MSPIKYSAVRVNGLVNAGAAFINAEGMAVLKAKREAVEVLRAEEADVDPRADVFARARQD